MVQLSSHMQQVYAGEGPAFLPALPFRPDIDWNDLFDLPFGKLMQARAKLFRRSPAVREELCAGQPEHILRAWRADREEEIPFIGPLRLDCVVTPGREVFCNEIDLLPGGPGVVIALESFFFDGETPTLDAYCEYLERVGVECLALVGLSSEADLFYSPERNYMARKCREQGLAVWAVEAKHLEWRSDGPYLPDGRRITHVDRFYCGWQLGPDDPLWRLAEFGVLEMPSLRKEYLEAKLWDALLWDVSYRSFWEAELGRDFERFTRLIPETRLLRRHAHDFSGLLERGSNGARRRARWVLKEGAPAVPSNCESRSVHQASTLPIETLTAVFQHEPANGAAALSINGWHPTSPILQSFVRSDKVRVPLQGGRTHTGYLRCSPFVWLHPRGSSFSRGLATVRPTPIVYDVGDAVITINV